MLGVKASELRNWEQALPHLAPQKNKSGHRVYTRKDVELLFQLRCLLYEKQFSLEGARALLEQGTEAMEAVITGKPIPVPSEPKDAAQGDSVQWLQAAFEAEQRARQEAERRAAKALEDLEFWKHSARKAEAQLEVLERAVRHAIEKMKGFSEKG